MTLSKKDLLAIETMIEALLDVKLEQKLEQKFQEWIVPLRHEMNQNFDALFKMKETYEQERLVSNYQFTSLEK